MRTRLNPHLRRSAGFAAAGLFVCASLAVLPRIFDWIRANAQNLPVTDPIRDYCIGVFWAAGLGLAILFWPVPGRDRRNLLVLWGLKCAVVFGVLLSYEAHYFALDSYNYYYWSQLPNGNGWHDHTISFSYRCVVFLTWCQNHVLPSSYRAETVSCAMVGLVALYLLFRAAEIFLGHTVPHLLLCLGVIPSILFWSSIYGKDPLVLLGVALYTLGVVKSYLELRPKHLLLTASGVIVAGLIRPWMALMMLAAMLFFLLRAVRSIPVRVATLGIFAFATLRSANLVLARFQITSVSSLLTATDRISQSWAGGGSGQSLRVSLDNWRSILIFYPKGLFTALFRPLPGDVRNLFGWMAGLENLLLLLLVVVAVSRMRRRTLSHPLVLWVIIFIAAWASGYAFVSYQNLGTAERFRLEIAPLIWMLSLALIYRCEGARITRRSSAKASLTRPLADGRATLAAPPPLPCE